MSVSVTNANNLRTSNFSANNVADAIDQARSVTIGGTTTGSSTAFAVSPTPAWTSYAAGDWIIVHPHTSNTGAATLNVSGLGTKSIRIFNAALAGGELPANTPTILYYDGTYFQVVAFAAMPPLYVDMTNGLVGVGTASPASGQKLDVRGRIVCGSGSSNAEMSWRDTSATTVRWSLSTRTDVGGGNSDLKLLRYNSSGVYQGLAMQVSEAGNVFFATAAGDLTASAANCYIQSSDGRIMRSTSSARYKRDIEDILPSFFRNALLLRARWFRSKNTADRPDWSHYGLIAEEVAAVEPRLVHWDYTPESYEEVTVEEDVEVGVGEDGQPILEKRLRTERRLRSEAELRPDGVQYERLAVLLLPLVQEHEREIAALKARNEALETRLAALESRLTP